MNGNERKEVMTVLTMLSYTAVRLVASEREARLRRTPLLVARRRRPYPVRRWVGRQLVRTGAWLANDPTMRPVRAR
jgi:hypothetical protein